MNVIKFKRDTSFRNDLFTPESFAHPAKLDSQLLIWIVERYTKPGETILDPMFGSGTAMLACMLGRNVIGVELEQKFVDMAKANWEKVRQRPQLGSTMGNCQILQGDARNLEGLLANVVLTSPPYPAQTSTSKQTEGLFKGRKLFENGRDPQQHSEGQIGDLPYGQVDKIVTSPPFGEAEFNYKHGMKEVTKNFKGRKVWEQHFQQQVREDNIGNLPYGSIDHVITSPPYEGSIIDGNENFEGLRKIRGDKASQKDKFRTIQFGKETTGYGSIDSIITSPPYEEAMGEKHHSPIADKVFKEKGLGVYTDRIDHIVTSPPYEASVTGQSGIDPAKMTRGQADNWKPRDRSKEPAWNKSVLRPSGFEYSPNKENIGNLKSASYLEAMAQVYSECHKVLKPGGLMILITKNFIREQKEIRLDLDTIKLAENVGFHFQERWYRELPAQSFWRIIYKKRFPLAPELKYEDVLVFRKEQEEFHYDDNLPENP